MLGDFVLQEDFVLPCWVGAPESYCIINRSVKLKLVSLVYVHVFWNSNNLPAIQSRINGKLICVFFPKQRFLLRNINIFLIYSTCKLNLGHCFNFFLTLTDKNHWFILPRQKSNLNVLNIGYLPHLELHFHANSFVSLLLGKCFRKYFAESSSSHKKTFLKVDLSFAHRNASLLFAACYYFFFQCCIV